MLWSDRVVGIVEIKRHAVVELDDKKRSEACRLRPAEYFADIARCAGLVAAPDDRVIELNAHDLDPRSDLQTYPTADPQHSLYFQPDPHGHGSFRPTLACGEVSASSGPAQRAPIPLIGAYRLAKRAV
jgi:hypothetical protein